MPRLSAISLPSAGWIVPENSIIRFLVMISTVVPLPFPLRAVLRVGPLPVALHRLLVGPLDRERTGRHVVRDHRARPRYGALADSDRRHQHRIRPDPRPVGDHGRVLLVAVVVHDDGPRADVHPGPDLGVPDVGEVLRL